MWRCNFDLWYNKNEKSTKNCYENWDDFSRRSFSSAKIRFNSHPYPLKPFKVLKIHFSNKNIFAYFYFLLLIKEVFDVDDDDDDNTIDDVIHEYFVVYFYLYFSFHLRFLFNIFTSCLSESCRLRLCDNNFFFLFVKNTKYYF